MTNPSAASGLAVLMLAGAAALGAALPAHAATNATMSACFEQWQSEKDAGTVAKGELWADYYKACAARMKKSKSADKAASTATTKTKLKKTKVKPAPAADDTASYIPPEPTNADATKAVQTKDASGKPLSAGDIALHRRIKKCGIEWHQDSEKGDLPEGETWAQFWNACNMRLKKEG